MSQAYFIAIPAALVAGGFNATSAVVQQERARNLPDNESLSPRMLLDLGRDRIWLMSLGAGLGSYAFQGLALAFGPLSLVQPLVLSELVFAVPVSVRRHHHRLGRREFAGVAAIVVGLVVGIVSSHPRRGQPLASLFHWGLAIGAVVVLAGLVVAAGRASSGNVRASLYALAAATALALQSALFAATTALARQGIVELFTHWQSYALIPSTALGILLMQSAFQAGPVAASTPVVDASEPVVAIALGILLFNERLNSSAGALAGSVAGLALFIAGIALLDSSPLVRRIQKEESKERAS